jgi:4-hydroxybenzoate polyprenyltransferase
MSVAATCAALLRLTRYRENVLFTLVLTLAGVLTSGTRPGLAAALVLAANWCAIAFAFMINDIADAPDDGRSVARQHANQVSTGALPRVAATRAAAAMAGISMALYLALGLRAAGAGAACLVLGVMYSWRCVRLKRLPLVDVLSHVLMLGVLPYWAALWACAPAAVPALWLTLSVGSGSAYGQLYNQVRDFDDDRRAGLRTSAQWLGVRATWLVLVLLLCAITAVMTHALCVGAMPSWLRVPASGAGLLTAIYIWRQRHAPSCARADRFHLIILLIGVCSAAAWLLVLL